MGEANVEQHIIADKTLIRTAQITSRFLSLFWLFWYCSYSLTFVSCPCSINLLYWESYIVLLY